jgi:hypothetical protein
VVRGRELKIEAARSREDPILETDHAERHPVPNPLPDAWCGSTGLAVDAGVNASFAPVEYVQQRPSAYEQLSVPGARGSRAGPFKEFY